jgi:hypothetical protein
MFWKIEVKYKQKHIKWSGVSRVKIRLSRREIAISILLIISIAAIFIVLAIVPNISINRMINYFSTEEPTKISVEPKDDTIRGEIDHKEIKDLNKSSGKTLDQRDNTNFDISSSTPNEEKKDEKPQNTEPQKTEKIPSESENTKIEYSYTIQLASCREKENCLNVLRDNSDLKRIPFIGRVNLGDKGIWWRVLVGQFETIEDANKYKEDNELKNAIIIKIK